MADQNRETRLFRRDALFITRLLIVVFYAVGIAGMLIPATFPLFVRLTPLALLLGFGLMILFYPHRFNTKTLLVFGSILVTGFFTEVIGVNTGLIFGEYQYGSGLGVKLFHTPLIIAINWLFLVWASASIIQPFRLHFLPSVVIPAFLMLLYDVVMEQVAGYLDMWHWTGGSIPLQNYAAWFLISVAFQLLINAARIKTDHKIAPLLFFCQFLFFLVIYLCNSLS